MIFELHIKDFILIDEEIIAFKDGLNIITGETGAGKSMILGAISLVLGAAASKDVIRAGCDQSYIKCVFEANAKANHEVASCGLPVDEDWLIISREINAKGKSVSRVNGQIVTLNTLKAITQHLLDVHGQFDNQALFLKDFQLRTLDAYGGMSLRTMKANLSVLYEQLHIQIEKREALVKANNDKDKQVDFLDFQLNEINAASLVLGEDEEIEKSFAYYANLEAIEHAFEAANVVFQGEFGDGILGVLSKLQMTLKQVERYDDQVKQFSSQLNEQFYLLEDLSRDMQHYGESLSVDPEKKYLLEQRLNEINKLKTKYGQDIQAILEYRDKLQEERDYYERIESELACLQKNIDAVQSEYDQLASSLSILRKEAAQLFEKEVTSQLSELNMKAALFKVSISRLETRSATGIDDIVFMIATNPGQPLRPLKRIVSGGELSRLMLAIKIVMGGDDMTPTQIFDEIDAGISGITASVVGEKLHQLAKESQIICITHLPQIAVFADHHYCIQKQSDSKEVKTVVSAISGEEIISEIGRLVGGVSISESTSKHVLDMLQEAEKRK